MAVDARALARQLTDEEGAELDPASTDAPAAMSQSPAGDHGEGSSQAAGYDGDSHPRPSPVRPALIVGIVTVVMLAGLSGWLGMRAYQSHQVQQQRALFLQVGRQGAINLTTIDFQHADADVRRILDTASGPFHDDFVQRAQPFVDVVKRVQSKSVGTVTAAGLESESPTQAQVLVAVSVTTSMPGSPEERPRAWRMRITVEKLGEDTKVSNVEFVP
ncbi:MAG: Mce-associated rane protein [Streptosporangiaceae bacterium]|nr:Mce-associated rane protein [Streptosporangiaceae bacterium]